MTITLPYHQQFIPAGDLARMGLSRYKINQLIDAGDNLARIALM